MVSGSKNSPIIKEKAVDDFLMALPHVEQKFPVQLTQATFCHPECCWQPCAIKFDKDISRILNSMSARNTQFEALFSGGPILVEQTQLDQPASQGIDVLGITLLANSYSQNKNDHSTFIDLVDRAVPSRGYDAPETDQRAN